MATTRSEYTAESAQWFFVYLLVLGTPFSIYPIVATSTRGLKPFHFFALLMVLVGFIRLCKGAAMKLNAASKSVVFFCGVALFSLIGFVMSGGTWAGLANYISKSIQLLIVGGLVLSVSTLRVEKKHLRRLVYAVITISAVVSVYAVYQSLARIYGWPLAYLAIYNPSLIPTAAEGVATTRGGQFGAFVRPSAFFTEPSRLGQFLLTPTLLSLFLYMSSPKNWNRTYLFVGLFVIASAFVLAFSVGAYIALGAAVAIGMFLRGAKKHSRRFVLTSLGVLVVLSFLFYPILGYPLAEMIYVRVVTHFEVFGIGEMYAQSPFARTSVSNRLARMQEGIRVWGDHPFLGVGLNNFGRFFSQGIAPRIHSGFVQSLTEMGILGGIAFFTLSLSAPVALLRRWSCFSGWIKSFYIAVGLGLLGRAVWMVIAGNYVLEFFWLDMVLATLLLSYSTSSVYR